MAGIMKSERAGWGPDAEDFRPERHLGSIFDWQLSDSAALLSYSMLFGLQTDIQHIADKFWLQLSYLRQVGLNGAHKFVIFYD